MTVEELIEELKALPSKARVYLKVYDYQDWRYINEPANCVGLMDHGVEISD